VRAELARVADPAKAPGMQAYMKSEMPYLGVSSVPFRKTVKPLFAELEFDSFGAWRDQVLELWNGAEHREERYAAIELAGARCSKPFRSSFEALALYEKLVVTGAWWDVVDSVATHRIREVLQQNRPKTTKAMLQWSRSDDLWKRRSAIICQVGLRKETDLDLLYAAIEPAIASKEFFLRKAIGWALREYAWTDPDEVVRYVAANETALSGLSRREALKNVAKLKTKRSAGAK
jgi:3-methyladenine DNA glycosylase AlkD